jgi:hypothetical protein
MLVDFDHVFDFQEIRTGAGSVWMPLLVVTVHSPSGAAAQVPVIFDTGASMLTLRKDCFPLLGLTSWNQGTKIDVNTAGGVHSMYQYSDVSVELLGRTEQVPVILGDFPLPIGEGLFGRVGLAEQFGFGFWERDHKLYVCTTP